MNPVAEEILSYLGYADTHEPPEAIDISEDLFHSSNPIAEEIASYFGMAETVEEEYLEHYGMPRRSGRYPYGSGDNPYQHGRDFLGRIADMKKDNFTWTDPETGEKFTGEKAIYKSMGLTSTEYRRQVSWANYEKRMLDVRTAKSMKEDGLGATEIGRKMGLPESTVRSLLNPKSEDKMNQVMETVDFLRDQVIEKGMIDVGAGVEKELNISRTRLDTALDYLEKAEGCPVYGGGVPQPTNSNQQSNQKVLCLPGTKNSEIYDYGRVKTITEYISSDDGVTYQKKFTYPESLDSKRLKVRYADDVGLDGARGIDKDGIIELRPGCKDLSLGESRYSQVRIMVDGSHYLKGMAVYGDPKSFPDGVDVIFNTNKSKDVPALGPKDHTVLKTIKKDPENPFGSLIKDADQGGQYWYDDPKTGKKKLGLINKRADQGDWTEWANALPSQFLGKQSLTMAKKQLGLAKADKVAEYDAISKLENPTIKKYLLEKFADNCDSAAVHLKAAALPGQRYHVIIPINTLKDTEIYAPNYDNGTKLALIRYPHGGTFEIPILTVNNKNKLGNEIVGKKSEDAVGINHKIADRLSGADFDGDTVMCIPTNDAGGKVRIKNREPLKGLIGFDPKVEYGGTNIDGKWCRNGHEYRIMKDTQKQMGVISNLITDMTLGGAPPEKLARAVRHSMVVIDAEKHKLDYKQSEIDNDIASLKREFQIGIDKNGNVKYGGASTILSKAKGEQQIDKRQGTYKINMPDGKDYDPTKPVGAKLWKKADDLYYPDRSYNKKTGKVEIKTTDGKVISYNPKNKAEYKKYNPVPVKNKETGEVTYTDSTGKIQYAVGKRHQTSTRMAETDDAFTLVSKSRHPMEVVYAEYANDMKALGNKARAEIASTSKIPYSKEAKQKYQEEVRSLDNKLTEAQKNRPREREALRRANAYINDQLKMDPDMKKDDIKKLKQRSVSKYREEVGSVARRDRNINITDKEWEAIQAGAISETKLKDILNNTDIDKLRERATPKLTSAPSSAQIARIKAMSASNYTLAEIAKKTGFSTSTVSKYLKGKGVN